MITSIKESFNVKLELITYLKCLEQKSFDDLNVDVKNMFYEESMKG